VLQLVGTAFGTYLFIYRFYSNSNKIVLGN